LLANKDVLTSADPFNEIVNRIKADPALQDIVDRELTLVQGPMYQQLKPLFEVLHGYATAGSTAAFAAAVKVIERAIAIQEQLEKLRGSATTLCQRAFDALDSFLKAAVPDLEGLFSSIHSTAADGLKSAAAELNGLADQIASIAGADPALTAYVRGWAETFRSHAASLDTAFKEMAAARQAILDAVGNASACADFNFTTARQFAVLRATQQNLLAAWQQAVFPQPLPPAPTSVVANVAALWQKAAARITKTVKDELQWAIDATLAKAVAAGSSEWTKAEKALKEASDSGRLEWRFCA
jgi:hypothetical protein